MARKKSLFGRLRTNDDNSSNLAKKIEYDEFEDEFEEDEFEDDMEDMEDGDEEEMDDAAFEDENDEELEDEAVGEDEVEDIDVEEYEDEDTSNTEEELSGDYEGQLTIDVFQTPKEIIIKSTIAGVGPENIDVSIDNDMVTIKGERKNSHEVSEEDYYYQECYWGAFSRSVILPVDVIADKAVAKLKNGILTLRLPKAKESKTKKISVLEG